MTSTRHHNVYEDGAVCFWTSSVIGFIPVLASPTAARRLIAIWDEARLRFGVAIIGYVIMPNHFHIALWSPESANIKRFLRWSLVESSKVILAMVRRAAEKHDPQIGSWLKTFESRAGSGTKAALWKERGRAFPVSTGDGLRQKLSYMHENPVRKQLVTTPDEWEFSSASWYSAGTGPIPIDSVEGW